MFTIVILIISLSDVWANASHILTTYNISNKDYLSTYNDTLPQSVTELPFNYNKTESYIPADDDSHLQALSDETGDYLSSKHLKHPKNDHVPPKSENIFAERDYLPPKIEYLLSKSQYLPPEKDYLPPKDDSKPKSEYWQSKSKYLQEKDNFPPRAEYLPPKHDYLPPKVEHLPPKKDYLPSKTKYLATQKQAGPSNSKNYLISKLGYLPPEPKHSPPKKDYLTSKVEYSPSNMLKRSAYKQQFTTIKPSLNIHEGKFKAKNVTYKYGKDSVLPLKNVNYSYPISNVIKFSFLRPPSVDRKSVYNNHHETDYHEKWRKENSNNLDQNEIMINEKSNPNNSSPSYLNSIEDDSYLLSSATPSSTDYLHDPSQLNYENFPPIPLNTNSLTPSHKYPIPTPSYAAPLEQYQDHTGNVDNNGYHYEKPLKEFVF